MEILIYISIPVQSNYYYQINKPKIYNRDFLLNEFIRDPI